MKPILTHFQVKTSCYVGPDLPTAATTIQLTATKESLSEKRVKFLKKNVAVLMDFVIVDFSERCLFGDITEFVLSDKMSRPDEEVRTPSRRRTVPLLAPVDTPSKIETKRSKRA